MKRRFSLFALLLALLLSLMIFATFNDVTRIINTPDEAPAVEKTAP